MVVELPAPTFPLEKIGSDGCLCGLPGCQGHPAFIDKDGQQHVEFTREQYDVIRAKPAKTETRTDSPVAKA
jgi:hypothetical protein